MARAILLLGFLVFLAVLLLFGCAGSPSGPGAGNQTVGGQEASGGSSQPSGGMSGGLASCRI